jgi:hypothetical protein
MESLQRGRSKFYRPQKSRLFCLTGAHHLGRGEANQVEVIRAPENRKWSYLDCSFVHSVAVVFFIVIIFTFRRVAVASVFRKLELIRAAHEVLALPNMFTAGARHRVGRPLLGELLFADWARFGHHIGHNLGSLDSGSPEVCSIAG